MKTNYLATWIWKSSTCRRAETHQLASDYVKTVDIWGECVINTKQIMPLLLLPVFARSPRSEQLKGFIHFNTHYWLAKPTLKRAVRLLGESEVFFTKQVHRLMLTDFHTGANIAISMQEEGEWAGQVLAGEREVGRVWGVEGRVKKKFLSVELKIS